MKFTGGLWNSGDAKKIFNATFVQLADHEIRNNYLYSFHEIKNSRDLMLLDDSIAMGHSVLIDSGTHSIYMALVRDGLTTLKTDDRSFDITTPELIKYFNRYIEFLDNYANQVWGYIELDLGNEKQKTILREKLEKRGYVPIPVIHPIGDSAEYMEYIVENYDRVCFGNIAMEGEGIRRIILQLMHRLKRVNPACWFHALGVGPNVLLSSFSEINSVDSSSSSSLIRFGRFTEGTPFGLFSRNIDSFVVPKNSDRSIYLLWAALGYRQYLYLGRQWNEYYDIINASRD